jgi:hypothetical protein
MLRALTAQTLPIPTEHMAAKRDDGADLAGTSWPDAPIVHCFSDAVQQDLSSGLCLFVSTANSVAMDDDDSVPIKVGTPKGQLAARKRPPVVPLKGDTSPASVILSPKVITSSSSSASSVKLSSRPKAVPPAAAPAAAKAARPPAALASAAPVCRRLPCPPHSLDPAALALNSKRKWCLQGLAQAGQLHHWRVPQPRGSGWAICWPHCSRSGRHSWRWYAMHALAS